MKAVFWHHSACDLIIQEWVSNLLRQSINLFFSAAIFATRLCHKLWTDVLQLPRSNLADSLCFCIVCAIEHISIFAVAADAIRGTDTLLVNPGSPV